jgi:hypothetical protein
VCVWHCAFSSSPNRNDNISRTKEGQSQTGEHLQRAHHIWCIGWIGLVVGSRIGTTANS